LPVLRKLKQLADAGATILGPRPASASGLTDFPASDAEVKQLADDLWGHERVLAGLTARDVLASRNAKPDFEYESRDSTKPEIHFIHRRDGDADIYFVTSRSTNEVALNCTFRVADKAPELWDPMTGEHHFAAAYTQGEGLTKIPLHLGPYGSQFIVFRESSSAHPATAKQNEPEFRQLAELTGPWTVAFDPKWGGPESAQFDSLVSWT